MSDKTLLIISQVYVPDPAAVGQLLHDAAVEMVRRGFRVMVITSARGYDDPTQCYPAREVRDGVEIKRLGFSSTGKKSIATRLIGQFAFLFQATFLGLFTRRLRAVLVSTSPPMASIAALVIHAVRRTSIKFWLMDLNPDQAVALGKVKPGSLPVRLFDWLNRRLYRSASDVVVLDRFMADRVNAKLDIHEKITILPPWPLESHLEPVAHDANPFRAQHHLKDKFVFMYSGNMSLASPLTTLLQAALRLRQHSTLHFMFIGGGLGRNEVEALLQEHRPPNITLLPYQPLEQLRYSLSAADVHLVTLGNEMVGIIHPCKVYGALAVTRPILFCGPSPSHIADLIAHHALGWHVQHGDVEECARLMEQIASLPRLELVQRGQIGRGLIENRLGKAHLCTGLGNVLQQGL